MKLSINLSGKDLFMYTSSNLNYNRAIIQGISSNWLTFQIFRFLGIGYLFNLHRRPSSLIISVDRFVLCVKLFKAD